MKTTFAAIAVLALAGCASQEPVQVAQAECKITPVTTDSVTGNAPKHATDLQKRFAQADLASSEFRFRQLRQQGLANNRVEDAITGCNQAD